MWVNPAALAWPPVVNDHTTLLRMGTGSATGVYYPLGSALAELFSDSDLDCGANCELLTVAQLSGGSKANIESLERRAVELALVQSDIAYGAYTGNRHFGFAKPATCLRVLSYLYPEYIHIVVRVDSTIKRLQDLRGHRVALDDPGSGTLLTARLILNSAGLTEKDIEPAYIKPDLAIKEFLANRIDAFFMVVGAPAPTLDKLATQVSIRFLPIDNETAAKVTTSYPYLMQTQMADNAYPAIQEVQTLAVSALLIAHLELDDELVYQLNRTLWHKNTHQQLSTVHSDLILAEQLNFPLPLHPGAERYLSELGWQSQTASSKQTCSPKSAL